MLLKNGDLASATIDNTIQIWDLNAGAVKRILTGHDCYVMSLALLENGD